MAERRTFAVVAEGIGRRDYSQNVENSVEPLIRSYQNDYRHFETLTLPPGGAPVQSVITITAETVVMLYDFYLSAPRNLLLRLAVEIFTAAGAWTGIIDKPEYQTVELHYTRGFPVFRQYRITGYNYGEVAIDANFISNGIVTSENQYYGRLINP